jgi:hypothetical protein
MEVLQDHIKTRAHMHILAPKTLFLRQQIRPKGNVTTSARTNAAPVHANDTASELTGFVNLATQLAAPLPSNTRTSPSCATELIESAHDAHTCRPVYTYILVSIVTNTIFICATCISCMYL